MSSRRRTWSPRRVGRLRQLRARAATTRCSGPPCSNTAVVRAARAACSAIPLPLLLAVLMSEVRRGKGLYSALAYLPVVVPPVVAVLLWKFFYDASPTGVFNTILGWVGIAPAALDPEAAHGDALARARGDLGRGRRHDHHLPGRAARRAAASCTTPPRSTAPGIWRKVWHVTLPQLRGVLLRHADPADHRHRAGVPRAVPVHRRRSGQRDDDRAAADLPVRVPEQSRAATTARRRR